MANNNSGSHRTGSSPSSRNNSGSRQRPGSYSERYNRPNPYSGYLPPGSAPPKQIYHPESVDPVRIKQLEREQEQARLHSYEDRAKMPHSNAPSSTNNHVQNQQSAQPPRSGNSRSVQEAARRGKQTRRSQVAQQHAARAGYVYRTPSPSIDEAHLNEIRQNAIDEAERLRSMPPEPVEIAAVTVSEPEQTPSPAPVPAPAPEPVAEVPVKNHTNSASFPVAGAAQFAAINNKKKKKNKSSAVVVAAPLPVDTSENSSADDASPDIAAIPVVIPSAVEVITPDAPELSVSSESPAESETPEITENPEVAEAFDSEVSSLEPEEDDALDDSASAGEIETEEAVSQEEPSENENTEEEVFEETEAVTEQETSDQTELPLPLVEDIVEEDFDYEEVSSDEAEPQSESDDEEHASEDTSEENLELTDDESYDETADDSAEDISSDDSDTSIGTIEDEEDIESEESSEPDAEEDEAPVEDEEYIQDDNSFSEEEYEDEDEDDDVRVYIPPEKESENTEYANEDDHYEEEDEYYASPSPVAHTPAKRRNFETRISSELADPSVYSPGVAQDETLFIRKKRPEEATAVFAASTPGLPPDFDDDDFFEQWLEEGDDMIIKDKRQRRRVSAIIGGVTMAFAIIGFIFVIAWFIKGIPTGSNSTNSQTDYAKFILPVVNADPEPFETISSVDNNILVEAAINRLTYGEAANDQTYTALEVENETRLLIPAADVEKSGKVLFGDTFTIDYTVMYAIEDEMIYYYSAADDCFHVVTTSGDIEPEIVKISHIGSRTQVLLEVGYISATEEAMEGSEYYKQMEYVLNALDNGKYYVSAIRAIEK